MYVIFLKDAEKSFRFYKNYCVQNTNNNSYLDQQLELYKEIANQNSQAQKLCLSDFCKN